MSLFKVNEWWSTPNEESDEVYGGSSLSVGNVTNDQPNVNCIAIGSFLGNLQIYKPLVASRSEENGESYGYSPDHLLLETQLDYPILQITLGKFVSGSDKCHLCILHPNHCAVYSVQHNKGQARHGVNYKLSFVYQHAFDRHAFSMVKGNFGLVKDKDFIAVQSLDGCLSIYEQESRGFVCFLPNFLLSAPFAYLPRSDTIVIQGSDWSLQSYKYQSLAALKQTSAESSKVSGKRVQPEWTKTLSENIVDIQVLVEPGNVSTILLLTTHHFICYKDTGVLKFIKKLEYNPACFHVFHLDKSIQICVATHTNNLLVYKETELRWATQLPFVPVSIHRATFERLKGGIVILGENGQLHVCFLGTDPSLFVAPPIETREINYEETDKELAQLHKIIRGSTKDTGAVLSLGSAQKDLNITLTVSNGLEIWSGGTNVTDSNVPCVSMVLKLSVRNPINGVRVAISPVKPIAVSQGTFFIRSLCDSYQLKVKFYLSETYVPVSLEINVAVSYVSASGSSQVVTTLTELPLGLVVKPDEAGKEADHKITITSNKPAVNLTELFPEFEVEGNTGSAIGFQYYGGANITVLSSRTTNRYRLQSDSLPAMWVILQSLIKRLQSYWSVEQKNGEELLVVGVASSPPLQDLFMEIDAHFIRRKKHKELLNQLEQRATQFRAVQRRLLTKYKDKTLTPLTNLDNLLEGTYKQILQLTEAINNNLRGLEEDGCQLSCAVRVVIELVFLQTGMELEQKKLLTAALTPLVHVNMDQGWEETVDCAVTFVLRTLLHKGQQEIGPPPVLVMPPDTTKLKKHIGVLVDRICKGGMSQLDGRSKPEDPEVVEPDRNEQADEDVPVPVGSRLGEDRARSARIRSARIQSARRIITPHPEQIDNCIPEETIPEDNTSFESESNAIDLVENAKEIKLALDKEDRIEAPAEIYGDNFSQDSWQLCLRSREDFRRRSSFIISGRDILISNKLIHKSEIKSEETSAITEIRIDIHGGKLKQNDIVKYFYSYSCVESYEEGHTI